MPISTFLSHETLAKPDAILFDWDNTLADTWPTIYKALHRTFEEMGAKPWSFEETKQRVHRSLRDAFPEIFHDRWEEAGKRYLSHFEAIHLDELVMLNGAEETLNALKGTGIYCALVSNKTGYNLRAEVDHIGWNHYFSAVIGAKDAEEDKPSDKPILLALEGTGLSPKTHDVWLVGDSITDLECAHNSGCRPLLFGDQDPTVQPFLDFPPQHHFYTHSSLYDVIRRF